MTDLLTRDHADSGDLTETARLDVGEATEVIRVYEMDTTPLLRLPVTDEHPTLTVPRTFEVISDPLAQPGADERLAEILAAYPPLRPAAPPRRGRHRAGHSGAWWLLTGAGLMLLGEASALLALLAVAS